MMVKPKLLARGALVLMAAALSCDRPVAPPTTGSIAIVLVSESGTPMIISDLPEGASVVNLIGDGPANILLDGVRVTVDGPTDRVVTDNTPDGNVFNVNIGELDPGTYTVTVEGLAGGKVAHYGTTSGVGVSAGQTATATISFPTFKPTLGVPSGTSEDTVDVLRFTVSFNAVTNATSYLVKWSTAQDMSNPQSKSITTTTTDVDVTAEGTYYYTVTAENTTVGTSGLPSDARLVNVVQAVATVTVTPATPTIAFGATAQLTADAKDALNNTVANVQWFWASSNHTVATVSQTGLVTSVGPGTAIITAVGKGTPGSTTLTVSQPPGTKLAFSAQPVTTVAGATMTSVKVAVQNALNQTVTGDNTTQITLAIGSNTGGGILTGGGTVTVVAGVATYNFVNINKTGTAYTLSATSGTLTAATSTEFNITPGTASALAFSTQPPNGILGDALSPALQVEIRDGLGNIVTSARNEITLAISNNPSSATLTGVNKVSAVNGVATFSNVALDKGGTGYTLAASASGFTNVTSSAFDVASSGPATKLAFAVQPPSVTADQYIAPLQVELLDAKGRRVTSDNATQVDLAIGSNPTGASLSGTASATASSGLATFTTVGIEPAASAYTLVASATGLTSATSVEFNVAPGAPDHLAFSVEPTNSVAGDALSPALQVQIQDFWNNRVTSANGAVTVAISTNPSIGGAGVLTGTKIVNAIDGIASFTGLWINKIGNGYTLSASAAGLGTTGSAAFNISPAAPAKLAFSQQPVNVAGNAVMSQVNVTITDQFDNATTASNQVTMSLEDNPWKTVFATGGTVSNTPSLTVTASNGTANFTGLRVDKPGLEYSLKASSGSLTNALSSKFNVNLAFTQIDVGQEHTCGLTANGTYCWGANYNGQLATVTGNSATDSIPGLVRGGLTFVMVTNGTNHTCGLTSAGAAYCWGNNSQGQLGNNSQTSSDVPVPVTQGPLIFATISAGGQHTCAITTQTGASGSATDRQVYCWGYNGLGQIGDGGGVIGTPVRYLTPQRVVEPLRSTTRAASITAGNNHTCVRTIEASNNAMCWGYNYYGQLGNNAVIPNGPSSTTPVTVSGGYTWTSLSAGNLHTCGIRVVHASSNPVMCWGYNGSGQLGNGNNNNFSTPQEVSNLNWLTVATGPDHTCAVLSGGTGYCWGYNGYGQLGDDSFTTINTPVQVNGSNVFVNIVTGYYHTCGRTTSAVYCWGANWAGQLGSPGTGTTKRIPTQVIQ
jgi:alpha-tubulin suppressor-like RCC1 family protein